VAPAFLRLRERRARAEGLRLLSDERGGIFTVCSHWQPSPARRYGHLRCQQKWPRPRTSSAAVFSPCQKYGALLALAASPVAFYGFTTMLHARRERHSLSGTRARAVKERKRTAGHCSCLVLLHYTVRGPHVAMCVCGWITCTMLLLPPCS
jgi:hypothetical protein